MLRLCSVPNYGPNGAAENIELDPSCGLLSVALLNARSIINKIDLFPLFVTNYNVNILLVSETWLRECYPNSLLGLDCDFVIYRKDRSGECGGGVCAIISKTLNSVMVDIPAEFSRIELVCFDVFISDAKYRFIVLSSALL